MRKPDGVPVSDVLTYQRSLSNESTPELALLRPGMRRKSVLPSSLGSRKAHSPYTVSDDSEDADEIEDSLLLPSIYTPISDSGDTSSLLSDAPSTSSRSTMSDQGLGEGEVEVGAEEEVEAERVPTPIPPMKAVPTPTKAPSMATLIPKSRSTAVPAPAPAPAHSGGKTSPRKAQPQTTISARPQARRPSTMVKPRPSRVITPSAKSRDALASVPVPNLPARTATSGISKRL